MVPTFALSLSFDGIGLLQRSPEAWHVLGRASLEGDLSAEMAGLRARLEAAQRQASDTAETTAPSPVLLILPPEQVRFVEVADPGAKGRSAAAQAALEGATPYALDDLVIDSRAQGGRLHLAAVARETLTEAETFATSHRFVPMGFACAASTATAPPFVFGPAEGWQGAAPTRPAQPLTVTEAPLPRNTTATGITPDKTAPEKTAPDKASSGTVPEQGPDAAAHTADAPLPRAPRRVSPPVVGAQSTAPLPSPPEDGPRLSVFDLHDTAPRRRPVARLVAGAVIVALVAAGAWSLRTQGDSPETPVQAQLTPSNSLEALTPPLAATPGFDSAPSQPSNEGDRASRTRALTEAPQPPTRTAAGPRPPTPTNRLRRLTPEEAEATYAATGIWLRAPAAPDLPQQSSLQDLYLASIDPRTQTQDAIALPAARRFAIDAHIAAPALPPRPGQTFDMDDRGLVRATPEGALTPDGVRVYLGPPPVIPPSRQVQRQPTGAVPADSPLARILPRARPDNHAEMAERATHGGNTLSELAALRPQARPRSVQEEAAEDAPDATAQAVARSLMPRARDAALATQMAQALTTRAAPAPVRIPPPVAQGGNTPTSVAQAATLRDALPLGTAALVGIFGSDSRRSALVSMGNGQFEKVTIGDRLDGGQVRAITESQLIYTKGSRTVTLTLPRG